MSLNGVLLFTLLNVFALEIFDITGTCGIFGQSVLLLTGKFFSSPSVLKFKKKKLLTNNSFMTEMLHV